MAPMPVIDYVVVYELVHLIEKTIPNLFGRKSVFFFLIIENKENGLRKMDIC